MAAKLKGLQAWCKQQCEGYRDVQVTNLTASFKSGLAFCAIIHRYRPDIIDYDSLSKENIFENNKLAFEVASNELGIAALLDAEDMVAMRVPDKLCIVTYVAQYYNYFRDKPPVGGPGVKQKVAVKRHTPKENVEPVHDTKRQTTEAAVKQRTTTAAPSGGSVVNQAKRNTFGDKCAMCGKKVYVLERHFEGTTLYHRRCIRGSQRASSFAGAGETGGKSGTEHCNGNGERENRVPPHGSSSLLTQLNGGPKPYSSPRDDDVGNKSETVVTPRTSSLLTQLRGGPAPYKGEATTTPPKANLHKSIGASCPPSQCGKSVDKMDVDVDDVDVDDVPPPLPLSRVPPRKPARLPDMTRLSTVSEMPQPAPVAVAEDRPKWTESDRKDLKKSSPIEKSTVLSGLLHNLANVRQGSKAGTNSPPSESHLTSPRVTQNKTASPVSKPDVKLRNNESRVSSAKLGREIDSGTSPHESNQQREKLKQRSVGAITTQRTDSSHDLKTKINAFEHAKSDSGSQQGIAPGFSVARRSTDPVSGIVTSLEQATIPQLSQPHSILKSTSQSSTNDRSSTGPTIIRPPTSILKYSSHSTQGQPSSCVTDGLDSKPTVIGGRGSSLSPLVSGNNFSAFNINDSIELDIGKVGDISTGKPAWQVEVASKIHKQSIPQHGKKEARSTSLGTSGSDETEWQKEARRRDTARGGNYSDPERKHVHIIKVPSSRPSTGSEGSPAERVRSPVGSPAEQTRSPAERTRSPAERVVSPVGPPAEQTRSPAERTRSPAERIGSPAERIGSPVGSPAEQTRSPAEQIGSPVGSPAEQTRSPAERIGSPAKRIGSPVRSPAERMKFPTERVLSPAEEVRSPAEHVAKNNQPKRGDVFFAKDKRDDDTAQVHSAGKAMETPSVADGKTEWQVEAERRRWNRLHKDEHVSPTPVPRRTSGSSPLSPGGATPAAATEVERAPSPSLAVDMPSHVRMRTDAVKTEWQVDAEKRKSARNGAVMERTTVEYTEVVIDNGPTKTVRPHVIGRENRVDYADVHDMKKVIRPETRFSFNSRDFKPATNQDEPAVAPKQPPARPPTLPYRKNRRAPLPPTIGRPPEITPKRTVNAEKRMSPLEICRQLRHLDIELRDLEAEGRELEVQIRSGTDEEMDTSDDLMVQWFGLINQRNELVRKEADLMYRKKQQELEGIHEDVEYELRCLMDKPDSQKTSTEKTRESVLLQELLETVNMRNSIVDCMEEDRIRYIEEDQEIADVLAMKSLGSEAPPQSKADTKQQGKKQSKKLGYMQPMAAVR